ncbi:hypothetical protein B0H13DRAFT_1984301 [Mycena leptocephala]|nr:hypothetical protein B0H13DRAFT_1984301 [Mycena leptocephala]
MPENLDSLVALAVNDSHDTTIDFAASFLEYWLLPLLTDPRVNDDETLILLTFDETETYTIQNNVFVVALAARDDGRYDAHALLDAEHRAGELGVKNLGRQDTNACVIFFACHSL